jgi:hypothetical protein
MNDNNDDDIQNLIYYLTLCFIWHTHTVFDLLTVDLVALDANVRRLNS